MVHCIYVVMNWIQTWKYFCCSSYGVYAQRSVAILLFLDLSIFGTQIQVWQTISFTIQVDHQLDYNIFLVISVGIIYVWISSVSYCHRKRSQRRIHSMTFGGWGSFLLIFPSSIGAVIVSFPFCCDDDIFLARGQTIIQSNPEGNDPIRQYFGLQSLILHLDLEVVPIPRFMLSYLLDLSSSFQFSGD